MTTDNPTATPAPEGAVMSSGDQPRKEELDLVHELNKKLAPAATRPAESESYNWASMLDRADPTLSDLATGADELAIPLRACREVLSKVGDGEMGDPPQLLPSLAIALVALMDKVDSKRERLSSHLYRLAEAERTTAAGTHVPNAPSSP